MIFEDLDLIDELLDALDDEGYEEPTPIQKQAIPKLLEGRDLLGIAQTGTGKTAAFSLPILQHIAETEPHKGKRRIAALVVTPTRELAAQIGESFHKYGRYLEIKHTVVFGGVKQGPQVSALRSGVDVLVATPGRLLDLEEQGHIDLSHVRYFVLDEADRMLDMGFVHDIRRILRLVPREKQNLLFSATMPSSIATLAGTFLDKPVLVSIEPEKPTVDSIEQRVMFVSKADKKRLLPWLIDELDISRAIVFTRTKHGANRLVKQLQRDDFSAAAIHGNKSQGARLRSLEAFKAGDVELLVATDLASRGLDIEAVEYVFNYDLPNEEESYVHRIGRTGRAGRGGIAISFCDDEEGPYLRDIERLIGFEITRDEDHPWHAPDCVPEETATQKKRKRGSRGKSKRFQHSKAGTGSKAAPREGGGSGGGGGGRRRGRGGGRGRGTKPS